MDKYEVTVKEGAIELPSEALDYFARVKAIDETIKALKAEKDSIEKPLKDAMKKHGVTKFEIDGIMSATTVASTMTETVDTEKMKRDGIYDQYKLLIPRDGYVRLSYKK